MRGTTAARGKEDAGSNHELARDVADRLLGERAVLLEDLEELALREFRDDAELALRLEVVEHLHDVLVVQRRQDRDLLA